MIPNAPRVRLRNGLQLLNFSSPHGFLFEDGHNLLPCSEDRARALSLKFQDLESPSEDGRWIEIKVMPLLTTLVESELLTLTKDESIDLIVVPRMLLDAIPAERMDLLKKARTCRLKDRIDNVHYMDRFCPKS